MPKLKIKIHVVLGILSLFLTLYLTHPSVTQATTNVVNPTVCSVTTLSASTSPNKAWTAVTFLYYCQGDYIWENNTATVVKLVSNSNPNITHDIFGFDSGGDLTMTPRVKWTSNTNLSLAISKTNLIGLQESTYSGIVISYTYK